MAITASLAQIDMLVSPAMLFRPGDQGAWFDPVQFSQAYKATDFSDPITAAAQSVAALRDLTGNGNHAIQPSAGLRPTFGRVPVVPRRNLLGYSADPASGWVATGTTISASTGPGNYPAMTITTTGTNSFPNAKFTPASALGAGTYTASYKAKSGTSGVIIFFVGGSGVGGAAQISRRYTFSSGLFSSAGTSGSVVSETATDIGSGWVLIEISFIVTGYITDIRHTVIWSDATSGLTAIISEPQLELASAKTAFQWTGSPAWSVGRRNLLAETVLMTASPWVAPTLASRVSVADGDGGMDAIRITGDGVGSFCSNAQTVSLGRGTYAYSIRFKQGTNPTAVVYIKGTNVGGDSFIARKYTFATGLIVSASGVATVSGETITNLGGGWFEWRFTFTAQAITNFGYYTAWGEVNTYTADYWAPQLERVVNTDYQKVISAYDVTEAGVRSLAYLGFDLVDDVMAVTLPDLGTDATEFWAVNSGPGTVINTGLTIGSGLRSLPATGNLYAYGVINRALDATETALLTAYLNFRRGS